MSTQSKRSVVDDQRAKWRNPILGGDYPDPSIVRVGRNYYMTHSSFNRGEWYYLLTAQGGTAGPATSHMVVVARARHPMGPWTNAPCNPLIHTRSREERWWSVGHGTIVDTPSGEWWHGPEPRRAAFEQGGFRVKGKGNSPKDCAPLACIPVHHAYEIEVDVEILGEGRAGIALFYSPACFLGLGLRGESCDLVSHQREWSLASGTFSRARLRIRNDRHEVSLAFRPLGRPWQEFRDTFETSGYHHNVFGGFLSLRAALWSAGSGAAVFRNFRFTPLPGEPTNSPPPRPAARRPTAP